MGIYFLGSFFFLSSVELLFRDRERRAIPEVGNFVSLEGTLTGCFAMDPMDTHEKFEPSHWAQPFQTASGGILASTVGYGAEIDLP